MHQSTSPVYGISGFGPPYELQIYYPNAATLLPELLFLLARKLMTIITFATRKVTITIK